MPLSTRNLPTSSITRVGCLQFILEVEKDDYGEPQTHVWRYDIETRKKNREFKITGYYRRIILRMYASSDLPKHFVFGED